MGSLDWKVWSPKSLSVFVMFVFLLFSFCFVSVSVVLLKYFFAQGAVFYIYLPIKKKLWAKMLIVPMYNFHHQIQYQL